MNGKTKALRSTGAVLLLASGLIAFIWFIWLAPARHLFSTPWIKAHSRLALWEEAQKSVGRIGVTHDVGIEIGRWGDKAWAVWIINHIKPGQDIANCEASHLGQALSDITNHQLKPEAEIWLAWWKANQNKTQVEWIREGFAERGVVLQDPLTTNNIIDLLKLANITSNSPAYTDVPRDQRYGLQINAFRWLRDSDVSYRSALEIWNYNINNIPEEDRNRITLALLFYAEWYGENWNSPGKLPLKNNSEPSISYGYETIFEKLKWFVYCTIPMLAFAGIWLMRRQPPK